MNWMAMATSPRPASVRGAGAGVLRDVLVDAREDLEGLVLAEDLVEGGDDGVGRPGGVRVGHGDEAPVSRVGEIAPGLRERRAAERLLVDDEADRAGVERDVLAADLVHQAGDEVVPRGGLVELGDAFTHGDEVRIAGAAEPDVEDRVGGLGAQARERVLRAHADELQVVTGGLGEGRTEGLAPGEVGGAEQVDALGRCRSG
jgi:hypothetical protein